MIALLRSSFLYFPKNPKLLENNIKSGRSFWVWLNIMFNRVDQDRIKEIGYDRGCAEWLLRNGGHVTFAGEEPTNDYNSLARVPPGLEKQLIEIDASEATITHHGFKHLEGCKHVHSIKFHKNAYLNDVAVSDLQYVKKSLKKLHISCCEEVTDQGVLSISQLKNLSHLTLYNLGVKNWKQCREQLQKALPECYLHLNESK